MNNTTSDDYELTYDTFWMLVDTSPESQAAWMIWRIYPAVLLVVGGFGNIATVCIMRRMKDQNSSQHAIFMALAISDLIFLCTTAGHEYVKFNLNIFVQILHPALCKILIWLVYVTSIISAWLVTCVTVQRTMAVLWPHRMRVMCTVRRTWIVITIITIISCVMNVHLLVGLDIVYVYDADHCHAVEGLYRYFFEFVYAWVHGALVSAIPFVCQFICDIILSVTLIKAVSSASIATRVESNAGPAQNTDSRKNMSYRTTVMVLVISVAFLVLTTPFTVYLTWIPYVYNELKNHPNQMAVSILLRALVFQLWYTNSAINFYLYCLTGTKFKREFINWISSACGVKSSSAPSSVHETSAEASRK